MLLERVKNYMSSDIKEAQLLLKKANNDLIAMRHLTEKDVPDEIFGFHAQQAVEKSLKAWIAFLGIEYPFSHDLETLYNILNAIDPNVFAFQKLIMFTPFSVALRYSDFGYDEVLDRDAVMVDVAELIKYVEKKL